MKLKHYFETKWFIPLFLGCFLLMFYIPIFSNLIITSPLQHDQTPSLLDLQTSERGFINESDQEVFWFVHVTDLHLSELNSTNNFDLFLKDMHEIIEPSFTVNTGDLVDSRIYGLGSDINQWYTYKNILTQNNAKLSFYIDLVGNHDVSVISDYVPFLQYSMLGSSIHDVNYSFTRNHSFGNYAFICLDTVKDSPYTFPYLDFGFDGFIYKDDLDWYESKLKEYKNYDRIFAFSHHPDAGSRGYPLISELSSSNLSFVQLTDKYNVSCHISGHIHENLFEERNETFNLSTEDFKTAGLYRIIAIDHGQISTSIVKLGIWPQYVLTYPPSNKFASNGFINDEDKIRVLAWHPNDVRLVKWSAFSPSNTQITPWKNLSIVNQDGPLWEGDWNSTLNGTENYEIRVRVIPKKPPNNSRILTGFIPIIIIGGILITGSSILGVYIIRSRSR